MDRYTLNQIKNTLLDYEKNHSIFQIDNFIIGKQGDLWAQYKQCLREMRGRIDNLEVLNGELELIKIEIASFKLCWPSKTAIKKKRMKKVWKKRKLEVIAANIIDTEREAVRFAEIAEKLKGELGEITPERRYQLETESWKNKGIKMAAIDILATGRISNQTYDFIFSLPKESQLELFSKLSAKQPMALLGFEPDEIRAITKS